MSKFMAKNKRGSVLDLIQIMVVLFVISITALVVYKVSDSINDQFQSSDILNQNAKDNYNKVNNMFTGVIDYSILFLVIGLSIVALVLAGFVRFHPVFIVFYLIMLAGIIFVCGVFSNVYLEMASQPGFSAQADALTLTTYTMWLLPFIVGIVGFLLAIIMYKNWSAEQ